MIRATVVGAGAWGTALAHHLARQGHDVRIWAREPEVVAEINEAHANSRFLEGVELAPSLRAADSLDEAVRGSALVVYAAPSHVLRGVVRDSGPAVADDTIAVVASKGIERETLAVMTSVVAAELPRRPVVAFSGPSFAAEVAKGQPTAVVAAADAAESAERVQEIFSTPTFRVYTDDDVLGVELGGALKNVMAIATGIAEGIGLGFNARAALITRGLAEISRLGAALGASPATFAGLAGIGDLVLTCTGALSRNRALGIEIGKGSTLERATAGRLTVAEGVITTRSALALAARERVEMPIAEAVHRVLFDGQPPDAAIGELMSRELRAEKDR